MFTILLCHIVRKTKWINSDKCILGLTLGAVLVSFSVPLRAVSSVICPSHELPVLTLMLSPEWSHVINVRDMKLAEICLQRPALSHSLSLRPRTRGVRLIFHQVGSLIRSLMTSHISSVSHRPGSHYPRLNFCKLLTQLFDWDLLSGLLIFTFFSEVNWWGNILPIFGGICCISWSDRRVNPCVDGDF